ncbi:MAG: ROK family protein [Patescibacteria group bacterium]|nr:ROK family protein [Patescibacteria group bacterium]
MYIVADIGATKTRIAASQDMEKFVDPIIFDTPEDCDRELELISKTAGDLSGGDLRSIAMGKPLPLWRERDFRGELASIMQVPVVAENDTALVGLGEAHNGAGKGAGILAYITVSTGVGGVRLVGGRIDDSRYGFEIGGQYLSAEGSTSLEDMVSGRAIHKRFGMHPKELGKEHDIWEELAKTLAYGVHNTILHWSPERVVIGGSMMNEIGIPVDRVAYHVGTIMRKFSEVPDIVHSELGDLGGLWGGLARLRQESGK